jgi:hypothetical protein
MNNNIRIFYDNVDLFSGIAPTPFISTEQEFINFNTGWNQLTKLSLNGQLTGRFLGQLSYYEITSGFNLLLNRLRNNYRPLVISENSQTLFSGNNVIIDSISADQSSWYGVLPFTINFEIYETGFFRNFYGVVEPQETIDFSEENGLIVNLTHSISARGIKTGNLNAIDSAKNWVKTRTGNYNNILPIVVQTGQGSDFLLNTVKESIDRFNGVYKYDATYIKSTSSESLKSSILNYTVDLSSGVEDGIITTNIQGSFRNNQISETANSLRSGFINYDFYNIANNSTLETFNTSLNNNAISQSVTEEQNNNVLNFNITYNNDLSSNLNNDYNVSIETDPIKNITTVSLNAKIFGKYGDVNTRWSLVQDFYNNNFIPFSLARAEYIKEITNRSLFPQTLTESVTFNEYTAEIDYSATWSDKKNGFSENVIQLNSSVNYSPSINLYVANTSAQVAREHNVQNIQAYSLANLEFSITAIAKPNKSIDFAIGDTNAELTRLKTIYGIDGNNLLIDRSITRNNSNKTYSITEKYLYEGELLT